MPAASFRSLNQLLLFTASLLALPVAHATLIVDDSFDDAAIGTNTSGVGTGFASGVGGSAASVTEAGGEVVLDSPINGGRRARIASNEAANTTTTGGATYLFEDVNFAVSADDSGDGATHRTYLGIRGTSGAADTGTNPGEGFYVEFGFGELSGNAAGTSTFFYNDASNVKTTLASWTFDTLELLDSGVTNAELDVTINVNGSSWSLDILGDTRDGGSPISFSGTHAASSITNTVTTGYAFVLNQSESPNLELSLGRIEINSIDIGFIHPGIGLSLGDLVHVKANLAVEPWLTGYNDLAASSYSSLSYTPNQDGTITDVGHTAAENRNAWRDDMLAIHHLARMWYFTDNAAYAQKARDLLILWANTHTTFLAGETYLDMGYHAHSVFEGAEILRGTWPGWTEADTTTCKTYFENVWWDSPLDHLAVPDPLRSANQGMAQFAAALAIAVFNDDEVKFNQCLEVFRSDAAAALLNTLPNGQVGDTGRDSHDQGQVLLMAWAAETFWHQGVDVFSEYDNRLLAVGEYISRHNLLVDTPFIQAGTVYDVYPEIHTFDDDIYHSAGIDSKMLSILHSAYVVRKGMSAPYLEKYLSVAPQSESSFCHLMAIDGSTATAPAASAPSPAAVSSVTSLNSAYMGNTNAGVALYNAVSKTWTVSGNGPTMWYSAPPDYHFAYLPVTGDATIIAKLTGLTGGSTNDARAGLVFSENLTDTADMQAIIIKGPFGADPTMHSFRRGDVAHSHQGNSGSRTYPRMADPKVPYWLKIERIGDRVNCYSSPDGISWSCGESADYAVGATAYFGLAVSSDQTTNQSTATFTDVRITGGDGGEAIEIPEAPFAIYASPACDEIPLRWLESFEADTYNLYRSTQAAGPFTTPYLTGLTGTSYIDTNVNYGTHYYYAISAVNSMGESPLSPVESLNFVDTSWYEAEDYDAQSGFGLETARDYFGGFNLSNSHTGDWARYDDIPLPTGAVFRARVATYGAEIGQLEVRLGSTTGTVIGTMIINDTGGAQTWGSQDINLSGYTPGVHDLYLVWAPVSGETGVAFNLNWFDIIDPAVTAYDLGMDQSLTYDPTIHELKNYCMITALDANSTYLQLLDGSDFSNLDFTELGITSWTTNDFGSATATTWDGANLNGITLYAGGDFGNGDSYVGADFSNVTWGTATSTADLFNGGSGATSAATAANAINFSGADLSLITGAARTTMINNLGAFDGGTPIGPIIDSTFVANSGWDSAALIAAGWQYNTIDAFSVIEAEDYDDQSGVLTQNTGDTGGGLNLQAIDNGDWAAYYNVDFGSGANEFQARVASNTSGGNIEVRLGSPTGTLVGTAIVPGTGNWQSYVTVTASVSGASGVHDLYLVFTGGSGALFNLNWFTFNQAVVTHTLTYTAGANGSITGTSPQVVSEGNDGSAVTADADVGYEFVNWSDSSTDNPRTDTNVTGDVTVTANFQVVPNKDAFATIEAEDYDDQFGIGTQPSSEGGLNVQLIENGDWTAYYNVDFGSGANEFQARVASNTSGGNIEVRLGSPTGTLVGTAIVPGTGNWQSYVTVNTSISPVSGVQHVYLVYTGGGGYLFNLNWFTFTNTYTLTYTAGANGSISGTSPQTVYSGANGTAVTAVASTNHHFVNWSDGSTANPRTDTSVTGNVTVTANFAIDTYTLTYTAGANGSITGTSPQTIDHGSDGSAVTAVAATNYSFVDWSDGSTANPRTDLSVTEDVTVTANFTIDTYTLTYTAGANGSITGSSPQTVDHGSDGSAVTAVADANYSFVDWSDGSTDNPRTDLSVTEDVTVTANFTIDTYTLTYTAGANGSITGTSPQTVDHGSDGSAVTAVADANYSFVDWSDGSTDNPRTDLSVTEDVTVTANFTIDTYTLTYTAGANGSITGTSPQTVDHGSDGSAVTAVADANYSFVDWSDGSTDNPRTDLSVTSDVTVTANFALNYSELEEWRFNNFGTYANTGTAADDFDADFDGILNLIEYATGTDPNSPSIASFTIQPSAGSGLEVSFDRILDPSLNYIVEGTDNLGSVIWDPIWTGTGASADEVVVPDTLWPSGVKYFLRLSVSD
ncbi:MAG: carbohydrate-binding protein [Opitutaceae bacterium]